MLGVVSIEGGSAWTHGVAGLFMVDSSWLVTSSLIKKWGAVTNMA